MEAERSPLRRPARSSHAVIWTLSLLLFSLLGWSFIGQFEVVTTARGRVVSEGHIKAVQSAATGTIRRFLVREGDVVRQGDVLLELDPTLAEAELKSVQEKMVKLQVELIRLEAERTRSTPIFDLFEVGTNAALVQAQRAAFRAREENREQRLRELRAAYESRRVALEGGRKSLGALEARLAIARERVDRAGAYVDLAVPRFQFLQWKDELLRLEREVAAQQQGNASVEMEVQETQQRVLQLGSGLDRELNLELVEKWAALKQLELELSKVQKRARDIHLRAPEDGTVQKITAHTVGATVNPNDTLVYLVPAAAPLVLEVLLANEELGYMRVGQSVDVKFDAYPFQKYGRMAGRLAWISPDAELVTNSSVSLLTPEAVMRARNADTPQYYFRLRVQPAPESNERLRLRPGLTAQVDIHTDRRRVVNFFLYPLEKTLEEATRVR